MFFRRAIDWLLVKDYDAAKARSADEVAGRYSRGNVSVQNGWFLDKTGLEHLSASADDAMKTLQRRIPAK